MIHFTVHIINQSRSIWEETEIWTAKCSISEHFSQKSSVSQAQDKEAFYNNMTLTKLWERFDDCNHKTNAILLWMTLNATLICTNTINIRVFFPLTHGFMSAPNDWLHSGRRSVTEYNNFKHVGASSCWIKNRRGKISWQLAVFLNLARRCALLSARIYHRSLRHAHMNW